LLQTIDEPAISGRLSANVSTRRMLRLSNAGSIASHSLRNIEFRFEWRELSFEPCFVEHATHDSLDALNLCADSSDARFSVTRIAFEIDLSNCTCPLIS
jgi:hypothetical protein